MRSTARIVHEHVALGIVLALAALLLGWSTLVVGTAGPGSAISDRPPVSAEVHGDEVTIRWDPMTVPTGLPVVGYRVLVGETFALALPVSVTHVKLPKQYTRALAPGKHGYQVMAIDTGGSERIVAGDFEVE